MLHRGNTETGSVVVMGVSGSQPRTYPKVHQDHPGRAFHQGVSENLYSHPQSPKWRARADRRGAAGCIHKPHEISVLMPRASQPQENHA
jgi:hypothetical protein